MKSMKSIKELEQRIDFIILEHYATILELDKILEDSKDSNEIKLEKVSAAIIKLKKYSEEIITDDNNTYADKGYETIDHFKLNMLFRILHKHY